MPEASLSVLLVAAATSTTGGGERHVADLLRLLPKRGVTVALACPAGGDLPALARKHGAAVYEAPVGGSNPGGVLALRRAIEESSPDVIHAHGSRAALFARLADPRARERCAYTVHGIHVDKAGSAARRALFLGVERSLVPRTARFVTVCDSDIAKGARLGVLDEARATVVHNGIAVPAAAPASSKGRFRAELGLAATVPLVLSIGRFHEQKDQATLLRAWRGVIAETPDAVLALLGSGELEGRLREIAVAQGLGESVRFVAPRADLAPAYTDADVFSLSSRWEGLPYVVLEAMAFGLPVASTGVDGIPEAVVDGETGLIVPARDDAALANALGRLLGDPGLRERMGTAGRERVAEQFSLTRMVDGLLGVYRDVAGARS